MKFGRATRSLSSRLLAFIHPNVDIFKLLKWIDLIKNRYSGPKLVAVSLRRQLSNILLCTPFHLVGDVVAFSSSLAPVTGVACLFVGSVTLGGGAGSALMLICRCSNLLPPSSINQHKIFGRPFLSVIELFCVSPPHLEREQALSG